MAGTLLALMVSLYACGSAVVSPAGAAGRAGGLTFLLGSQRPDGGFPSRMCSDLSMTACREEHSVFPTALIVEALLVVSEDDAGSPEVSHAIARGLDFLSAQQEGDAPVWRVWTREDPMHEAIGPDLDDTAVVSTILRRAGRPAPRNLHLIEAQTGPSGFFRTWFGFDEPADCVVNLNVLAYLARVGGGSEPTCSWLRQVASTGSWEDCSRYYEELWSFPFFFARARGHGVRCLEPAVEELATRLAQLETPASPLGQALALAARSGLGDCDRSVSALASELRARQSQDGSWSQGPFFRGPGPSYFGSPELTTAMALRALHQYDRACRE